jgi:hypothetical protein
MAQAGYTPIKLYYSATTTNQPLPGDLAYGELGINIFDGKLFYKDNVNAIQVIGYKLWPLTSVTGTLPVANGGTGTSSFTAGALLKGAGSLAVTVASAADIVGQIGSTAVTNATNATNATNSTNIAGGTAGQIPYQTGAGTTGFISVGGSGQILQALGTSSPVWRDQSSANVVNAIVARDGSGNFAAGTITATTQAAGTNNTTVATTAFVQSALPGTVAGSIGSYMLATYEGSTAVVFGNTVAGNLLRPVNIAGTSTGALESGTWRCLGAIVAYGGGGGPYSTSQIQGGSTLWIRIS